jgi:uncharacterized protein YkwD
MLFNSFCLPRRITALALWAVTALLLAPRCVAGRGPDPAAPADGVVIYPVDGQKHVPTAFPGHEVPDPIPEAHGGLGGYPVTATFPMTVRVRNAKATLQDDAGHEVEAWASSPEKPANPDNAWAQGNTICLIAKKPLRPGVAYSVHMSAIVHGKEWSRAWSFTTAGDDEGGDQAVEGFLKRLNGYRKAAGLEPVADDPDLSGPSAAHARYLVKNEDVKDLNWNDEDPSLPGYSDEGRQAARRASVDAGAGPDATADWALASFIPRQMVLDAGLRKMGVGAARRASGGFFWVLDGQNRRGRVASADVAVFPAPDQKGVPAAYPSGEGVVPVPEADESAQPGYAVTAHFPWGAEVAGVEATLTDDAGKEVDAYLSTPARPAIRGIPQRCIGLVPKKPLRPDTAYTVTMSAKVGGQAWKRTWTFRTAGDEDDADAQAAAAIESLNGFRRTAGLPPVALDEKLSMACRLHARYVARNLDRPQVRGLGIHDEDPSLPGATPEGRRAGKASVISQEPDPGAAVGGWIATLYHRVPLLDPDLKKIGYACVRLPDQTWLCVLDAESGK